MEKVKNMSDEEFRRLFHMSPEPDLDLVRSVIHGQHRMRPIWNRLYPRPISETFHEFLVALTKWTFGEEWWKRQLSTSSPHAVVQWSTNWDQLRQDPTRVKSREVTETRHVHHSVDATGPVTALFTLGYDLHCTQAKNKLPARLVERLRRFDDFQGARYEIACAAIMMRGGFDIEFVDDDVIVCRYCKDPFSLRPKRRAWFVTCGLALPRTCRACRRTRERSELVDELEAIHAELFFTGQPLGEIVAAALASGDVREMRAVRNRLRRD